MTRRLPVFSTIIVLAAVVTMIGLGIWQLGRLKEKEALIARYEAATGNDLPVLFPLDGKGEAELFRRSALVCNAVTGIGPVAGTAANGTKGWVQRAQCVVTLEKTVPVDLGFSRDLNTVDWKSGVVSGVIAPGPRLVADPPVAGLQPMAKPDPGDLPNNHLAYAGQWFFFALTALVIYVLALRRRGRVS